ncbi:MAG: hypothetical protein QOC81_1437 [Thermoanaerobaculia bacterium]|jgi:hypothetical protein|nr:hypothetical protein [Thermoanaerobaculia bacterium]
MLNRSVVGAVSGICAVVSVFFKIVDHVRAIDFLDEVESSGSFAVLGDWLGTPLGAAIVSAVIAGLLLAVGFFWREARSKGRSISVPEEVVEEERVEEIHTKRTIRKTNRQ